MRVLVNPNVLAPIGGVEMAMLQVNQELARRGHEIAALYRQGGVQEAEWRELTHSMVQVPAFDFTRTTAVRDLRAMRPAIHAAAAARPDILHLNRVEQSVWGLLAARRAGVPIVTTVRNEPQFPGVGLVGRLTNHFIAVSHYMRRRWTDAGVPADRITVIGNGVRAEEYPSGGAAELRQARADLGIAPDGFVLLYYGRIAPEKGVDVLLEAWRRLAPRNGTLLLVGVDEFGPDRELIRTLQANQPPGCRWAPVQKDVTPYLHAADVVVLPAVWQEPFGRVVIEAMATGRPVVASRVGGIQETLSGEFASMLVEPGDSAELAARIGQLQNWRRDDPWLGVRCTQYIHDNYTLKRVVDQIEAVFAQVATARRASVPLGRVA